jgi:hypothetical protein
MDIELATLKRSRVSDDSSPEKERLKKNNVDHSNSKNLCNYTDSGKKYIRSIVYNSGKKKKGNNSLNDDKTSDDNSLDSGVEYDDLSDKEKQDMEKQKFGDQEKNLGFGKKKNGTKTNVSDYKTLSNENKRLREQVEALSSRLSTMERELKQLTKGETPRAQPSMETQILEDCKKLILQTISRIYPAYRLGLYKRVLEDNKNLQTLACDPVQLNIAIDTAFTNMRDEKILITEAHEEEAEPTTYANAAAKTKPNPLKQAQRELGMSFLQEKTPQQWKSTKIKWNPDRKCRESGDRRQLQLLAWRALEKMGIGKKVRDISLIGKSMFIIYYCEAVAPQIDAALIKAKVSIINTEIHNKPPLGKTTDLKAATINRVSYLATKHYFIKNLVELFMQELPMEWREECQQEIIKRRNDVKH